MPLPKDAFFRKMDALGLALTYADVRLKTGHSKVMPKDLDITSLFSRNVPLNVPIVSAAMDTVTEYQLAIAMAKLGGLGIIHKNMTPQEQGEQVYRVKNHLNAVIREPVTVDEVDTVKTVLDMRKRLGLPFHTFPVLDELRALVGIVSQNDFDFCDDTNAQVSHIMSQKPVISGSETTVREAYEIMQRTKKKVLPLVDKSGNLTGMYIFSDVRRVISGESTLYNLDNNGQLRVGAAIGTGDDTSQRLEVLVSNGADVIVIDTAHGDSDPVLQVLESAKKRYSHVDFVAGNVTEAESVRRLIDAGADGIKVGQGPGSICTTRIVAGIGCPQVTAVYQSAQAAGEIPICADGGIEYSGDIPIALGLGAGSIMIGSLLAGTSESPGETILRDGRRWKLYRGMGSLQAMQENEGSRDRYLQDDGSPLVPEGIESLVPHRGPLRETIAQLVGGLRKGMGYVGAGDVAELQLKTDFYRMSGASQTESHPHGVMMTQDAPNYHRGEKL
jgi:IMP dehydrogenase